MAAISGSLTSVTLRGRTIPVAGDSDVNRKKGGWENSLQMNGDGVTARLHKTRTGWRLSNLAVAVDDSLGDHEYIQSLADGMDFFPIGLSYADGSVQEGTGQVTGEIEHSAANGTVTLTLEGPGKLERQ